ncbi:branched-chain amino acid ABC transporter permease [Aminipila sp.]|uniref:branched-chain amino acid ABC transporter permease n=1 Tax=Aminipila sp. TaxID=2060095 RepID=UPI00289A655F|nr:branched-chain amino acid ABC transporter permease [Aminipila sp.]
MTKKSKTICTVIALLVMAGMLFSVNEFASQSSMLRTVLQLGSIYALAAVSMNLLNGFTGLFSLGQAGFMAIGAYTFAILTIPVKSKPLVYYLYGVSDLLANVELPAWLGLITAGLIAALLAAIIGAPVLRLKSDYFAIATLGFSEIVRILVASSLFNKITNGSLGLKLIPGYSSYYTPFIIVTICIVIISLLIKSSYGRAFKAIREDEIAAEAMGINLAKHKQMSFIISSFFAGIAGALLAMYLGAITSTTFPIMLTYNILLIVVIGGIGSITGSIISAFLVTAAKEWWLRFLDQTMIVAGIQIPFLRTGFRMVVFSIILMAVVLFWRRGIMGQKEFSWDGLYGFFTRKNSKGGAVNE